jgi:hypothetical protein
MGEYRDGVMAPPRFVGVSTPCGRDATAPRPPRTPQDGRSGRAGTHPRPPAPSAGHILGVTRWLAASKGQGGLGPSHARCGRSDARHYADRSPDARRLSRSLSGWPASAEALSMSSWTTSVAELRENASISCLRACR